MEQQNAVRALAALAHGHRLSVFRLLVTCGPSGLAAGDIAKHLGISPTALSFHVKELDRAGLIQAARDGRYKRYAVKVDGMRALLAFLTQDCCAGAPELCGTGITDLKDVCSDVSGGVDNE